MIVWLINHTPWWLVAVLVAIALAATWRLWSTIYFSLPVPLQIILAAVGVGTLAFLTGRNRGSASERASQKIREAQAAASRKEIDNEIAGLAPPVRDQRLDRWMRD